MIFNEDNKKRKVVIIGLDGATFNLLDKWINDGKLPVMKSLIDDGTSAELVSTIPFVTAPAWSSFLTGKNPGKHGLFDWQKPMRGSTERELNTSRDIKSSKMFEILNFYNKEVGLINVPMTYPTSRINKFMVSGILTPNLRSNFTYPQSLYNKFLENKWNYQIDIDIRKINYNLEDFVNELINIDKTRFEVGLSLFKEFDLDLFVIVFTGSDRIQHKLWHHLDHTHLLFSIDANRKYEPIILRYYKVIDEYIGAFKELLDPDSLLIIMSDHGFGPLHCNFNTNKWLNKLGLLRYTFKENVAFKLLPQIKLGLGIRKKLRQKYLNTLYKSLTTNDSSKQSNIILQSTSSQNRLAKFINWGKTLAYSGSSTEQGIYINVKGREPCGTVDQETEYERIRKLIIHELYNLKDHETNKKIISKVYKKEDIYKGPYLTEAPDIIFDMVDGYAAYNDISNNPLFSRNTLNDNLISGSHRRNGILIVQGNNVLRGKKIEQAEITDLLPTILFFMGLPIPKDLDGKILLDIFNDSFRDGNELSYCEPMDFDSSDNIDEEFDNDSEEVKRRLKDLGYL